MSATTSSPSHRIAILGGGITGLTAAWRLKQAGLEPIVFEKSARVGGAIASWRGDGWLHELGPNSLLETSSQVTGLIDEIGLGARRLYASPLAKQRYIVRDGALVAMPASPLKFATTKLFSPKAKLNLLGEPWRAPAAPDAEESVADFVVRRLGREFLDYAIDPFVGGVYAGDPTRLSVRHAFPKLHALEQEHGSLIRGALRRRNTSGGPKGRIFSFPGGLAELPERLARLLGDAVRPCATVMAVRHTGDAWEIAGESGGHSWIEPCAAVISALPARALASLAIAGVPEAGRFFLLKEIEHPPVVSVFTGFRRKDVPHPLDGFGMLMPRVEQGRILGTLFSSTLFPNRAPEGHVALTTFVGGTRQPELAERDDNETLRLVRAELARLLGITATPAFVRVKHWAQAIPQYELGYGAYQEAAKVVEMSTRGFFAGGNWRDGISLSNCIAAGERLAAAVVAERTKKKRTGGVLNLEAGGTAGPADFGERSTFKKPLKNREPLIFANRR